MRGGLSKVPLHEENNDCELSGIGSLWTEMEALALGALQMPMTHDADHLFDRCKRCGECIRSSPKRATSVQDFPLSLLRGQENTIYKWIRQDEFPSGEI